MSTLSTSTEFSLTPLPLSRFGYFLLYCGLIFLFLILFHRQRKNIHVRFLFLVWLILFAVIGFFGFKAGLASVMIVIMSAYAEEFLKLGATENSLKKADFYSSDVLFLSVLVALGFSIVENVLYVGQEVRIAGSGGSRRNRGRNNEWGYGSDFGAWDFLVLAPSDCDRVDRFTAL